MVQNKIWIHEQQLQVLQMFSMLEVRRFFPCPIIFGLPRSWIYLFLHLLPQNSTITSTSGTGWWHWVDSGSINNQQLCWLCCYLCYLNLKCIAFQHLALAKSSWPRRHFWFVSHNLFQEYSTLVSAVWTAWSDCKWRQMMHGINVLPLPTDSLAWKSVMCQVS